MMRRDFDETPIKRALPRIQADAHEGLNRQQVRERLENGYSNMPVDPPTKTTGQIIKSNVLTYFNLIFFLLAACVIAVGEWKELTFLVVVIINMVIGIFQELRSKRTLEKLSIISEPKATAIRDGVETEVNVEDLVLDDIVVFGPGNQIYADAIVLEGELSVNEALITGEADEIPKRPGDTLLSGSFAVSGSCRARLDKVGRDSFVSRLTIEAKKGKQKKQQSEMMNALTKLVKWISFIIIPFGIILFINQTNISGLSIDRAVVSTVAALIGMIPEGLYLLTSVALAVSVMRLAQKKTLVHELGCIETLARVDVLCVDKTGTITENAMIVKDIVPLCPERYVEADIRMIMSDYVAAMGADNQTMIAVQKYFTGEVRQTAQKVLPFSPKTKYSGVSFHPDENYLLGAPEFVLKSRYAEFQDTIEVYSRQGCRVLLLALYEGELDFGELHGDVMPLALILLTNKVRAEAPNTFAFFRKQGVKIKVISGDNPVTVSQVALEAGIEAAEDYVDASTLDTDRKLRAAAEKYTVFGRVTPEQKRKLIRAMKNAGHTVAMTGDGVNDVLALKTADCSIAMASGSDVACHVSQLVLMNSDFSAMPAVVMEGRRVINNIERSASLFLVKNIFSFLLAFVSLFWVMPYPVTPTQLSLISALTIGAPSFVLAMEPNQNIVRGHFLRNVLLRAFPCGITDFILVIIAILITNSYGASVEELATVTTFILAIVGFCMLIRTAQPFNKIRWALLILMLLGFAGAVLVLPGIFSLTMPSVRGILIIVGAAVVAYPMSELFSRILAGISASRAQRKARRRRTV